MTVSALQATRPLSPLDSAISTRAATCDTDAGVRQENVAYKSGDGWIGPLGSWLPPVSGDICSLEKLVKKGDTERPGPERSGPGDSKSKGPAAAPGGWREMGQGTGQGRQGARSAGWQGHCPGGLAGSCDWGALGGQAGDTIDGPCRQKVPEEAM